MTGRSHRPDPVTTVTVTCADWVGTVVDWAHPYPGVEDRMRLAITLARENVRRDTGGPFGAAVFEQGGGRLVAVGTNRVVPLHGAPLHAEIVALLMAGARIGSHTLRATIDHELVTSTAPCSMCVGAALWSGVTRLVSGADRDDARALGFDEGPVVPDAELRTRGVEVVHGVLRDEAAAVLRLYRDRGGPIYNG